MPRHIRKILFALIPITLLLFQQSSKAALEGEACGPEPTNMTIDYGDLITCSINPTGDTDTFRFTGSAGDTVDISVARRSGGDPCVELFNPQGGRLGGTCTSFVSRVRVMLTSTGVHTILVSELNGDATLDYTLSLERLAPPSPPAKPIFYGQSFLDEINPRGDQDLYYFYGSDGDTVDISVARRSGGDPCVELFNPQGGRLGGTCTSFVSMVRVTLTSTGVHTILVGELNGDAMLAYTISLQCLSGMCQPPPNRADLSLIKTDCPDSVGAGSTLTYKITVANSGPDPATSVTVTDILPPLTAFVSCSSTGGVCGGSANNRTVTFNSLAVGASETITLIAMVDAAVPDGIVLSNTAEVSSALFDPNLNNNAATATTTVGMTQMPGSLQFSAPSYSVNEDGGNATITVTRTGGSDGAVSVNYATANGTATAGSDYTAASGTLTFADGETSKTFTVPITSDSLDESDETVNLMLSSPMGCGAMLGSPAAAVLTILDDDPTPTLSINDVTITEDNGGTVNAVFTVGLSPASGQTVAVNFATANGTATAGSDYVAASGTLTFNPGDTGKPVAVQINGDTTDEADETFFVNLSGATNATIADSQGVCTITDDDPAPSMSINDVTLAEGDGGTVNAVFTVSLSSASGKTVTVDFATADAMATASADYQSASGKLTFNLGETSKPVTVTVNGDTLDEPDETFTVNLSNQTNVTIADVQGIGTIVNDDTPTLQFSAATFTAPESNVSAVLTVTRTGDTAAAAVVDYFTVDNPAAIRCDDVTTMPGVAFARCDYATTVDTLRFAAGETQKTLTIPIVDDAHGEPDETVTVRLSNPTGAALGAQSSATLTIADNDVPGLPNPIFTTPFFVRQHYLDFLNREPEPGEPWSGVLNNCSDVNNNPNCDRLTVSAAFFGSPEFRLKGFYVFTFYKVAFNRLPSYDEIIPDMRRVTGQTPEEVYQKRAQFAADFARRQEFRGAYDGLNDSAFVQALLNRHQLSAITTTDPQNPDTGGQVVLTQIELVNRLGAGTLTRAQVLRAIVQSQEVTNLEFNNAFVAMQYYGYLRRTPEVTGYNAWLNYLSAHPSDFRTMVNGFMNSIEYRLRFGREQ